MPAMLLLLLLLLPPPPLLLVMVMVCLSRRSSLLMAKTSVQAWIFPTWLTPLGLKCSVEHQEGCPQEQPAQPG
jgi:hypothetical protein